MAIIKRSTKGSQLTHDEMDNNWDELEGYKGKLVVTDVPATSYTQQVDTAHDLFTNDLLLGIEVTGSLNGEVDAQVIDNSGHSAYAMGNGATSSDFEANTAVGNHELGVKARNLSSVTQDITVKYWARKEEVTATSVAYEAPAIVLPISGTMDIASATYAVGEEDGTVTVVVNRSNGSLGIGTVDYTTADGTATAGADYTATAGTLTFAEGVVTQSIVIPILEDADAEAGETFTVTLSNPGTGITLGSTTVTTVTITDNDPAHELILDDMTGFAKAAGTTGGKGGELVTVTNNNASGAGSLRQAVLDAASSGNPTWINFTAGQTWTIASVNKTIPPSNITIDGRGSDVTISQLGFRLVDASNIVITHMKLASMDAAQDSININKNTSKIWINKCDITGGTDEGLDISNSGTDGVDTSPQDVTISYCHFNNNLKSALLGGATTPISDADITVTMEHCYLDSDNERMPKCNWGKYHLYNNYIYNPNNIATLVTEQAQCYAEGNVYEDGAAGGTTGLWAGIGGGDTYTGYAADVNNVNLGSMSNGGTAVDSVAPYPNVFDPTTFYTDTVSDPTGDSGTALKADVTTNAGWQNDAFPT